MPKWTSANWWSIKYSIFQSQFMHIPNQFSSSSIFSHDCVINKNMNTFFSSLSLSLVWFKGAWSNKTVEGVRDNQHSEGSDETETIDSRYVIIINMKLVVRLKIQNQNSEVQVIAQRQDAWSWDMFQKFQALEIIVFIYSMFSTVLFVAFYSYTSVY